jgi:uncharacterized Rmd1/YagE family protein
MKIFTYHLSDSIDIKCVKKSIVGKVISETNAEIFIKLENDGFMSAYEYGSVAFTNLSKEEITKYIKSLETCCQGLHISDDLSEDIVIEFIDEDEISYEEEKDTLLLPRRMEKSNKVIRIIMFDLSQTVALDYYGKVGDKLMVDIKKYSNELETNGKLDISKKDMMKFIGKSLNIKNNIVDTLYIFDSPEMTWSDQNSAEIHEFLSALFDIKSRYKETENLTQVIGDNMEVYKQIYEHKEAKTLELVVVVLIVIEVIQGFSHMFKFLEKKKVNS